MTWKELKDEQDKLFLEIQEYIYLENARVKIKSNAPEGTMEKLKEMQLLTPRLELARVLGYA